MRRARWDPRWTLGLGVLALACGGDGGGGTGPCTPGVATQLVKSGDGQVWYVNNPLPAPLSVTARDANNCAVPGVVVNWAVGSGGGAVNPTQSTTGTTGVATTTDSIGSSSPQTVTATFAGLAAPVTFTATGGAPPTSGAVTVGDNVFTPASVVVQVGSTVTWTWVGQNPHSVTFGNGTPTSATQISGPPYDQTFANTGTFNYVCKVHQNMNGSVKVVH
jgi:plastocyanin